MIRVFTSKVLDEALKADERNALITDFKQYKAGKLPALFGKDVPYDHPTPNESIGLAAEIYEVSITDLANPKAKKK